MAAASVVVWGGAKRTEKIEIVVVVRSFIELLSETCSTIINNQDKLPRAEIKVMIMAPFFRI